MNKQKIKINSISTSNNTTITKNGDMKLATNGKMTSIPINIIRNNSRNKNFKNSEIKSKSSKDRLMLTLNTFKICKS